MADRPSFPWEKSCEGSQQNHPNKHLSFFSDPEAMTGEEWKSQAVSAGEGDSSSAVRHADSDISGPHPSFCRGQY